MGQRAEVEHIEIGVVGVGAVHGHHILGGVVGQPAVQDVGADGGLVDLAALDHLGAVDTGLGVVDAAHRFDEDVVGVVVLRVLLQDPGLQRLVLGQIEGAAAVGRLGAGGKLVAGLLQQGAVGGLIGQVAQQAQEAGEIVGQGVGQGVVVHGLDAHGVKLHGSVGGGAVRACHRHHAGSVCGVGGAVIVHDAAVGVVQVDVVVVVILGTSDVGGDQIGAGGGVLRGQDVLQGVHKVLCGNGGHHFTVAVHPVLFPQGEGPGQGVGVPLPLGGQALFHHALVVVLHQRIHAVGTHLHLQVGGSGQVVQGRRLAVVQDGVAAAGARSGRPGGSAAAGGRTAAAGEQTGCAGANGCQTAGFQELTTGDGSIHKNPSFLRVRVSFPLFPGSGGGTPQRGGDEKRATDIHPLLLCNSPPATRVVSQSIALISRSVNRFWQFLRSALRQRPWRLPPPASWPPARRRAPWRGPPPLPGAFWCGA